MSVILHFCYIKESEEVEGQQANEVNAYRWQLIASTDDYWKNTGFAEFYFFVIENVHCPPL